MKASASKDSGASGGKRSHRCLGCCIGCLVVVVLFVGLVIGGSAFAFNKFVSPMIGGVKFGAAVRLLSGLYSGERNRKKIVTDPYTEEDLSDFYDELNAHLFQQVRGTAELEAEYAALSEEDKAAVMADLEADAKWNATYKKASNKEDVVKAYYVSAHRYPITIANILSAVNLDELTGNGKETPQPEEEYEPVAAAGDTEEGATAGEPTEDSTSAQLTQLLQGLHFDFTNNGLLNQFVYTEDENYAANIASVTFNVTGNQIAALVGEIVSQMLSKINLTRSMGADDLGFDLSSIYLPDYVLIPQVIIEHKSDLPENPTEEQRAEYNKNTYISVTLEMRFRALLNNKELQNAVKSRLSEVAPAGGMVGVGFGVVKAILPKTLFVTAGIYPLDSTKPAFVKINNYSEQSQKDLAKIINAVVGDNGVFNEDTVGTESGQGAESESGDVMQQLNAKVVDLFGKLDEKGVPLSFVTAADGKSVGLRLAHVQMLLSLMKAYDPTGENGITPYQFMTVLKCIFSEPTMVTPTQGDLDALYNEIEDKYGVDASFWNDGGLLNVSNLQNLPSAIDLKGINLRDNDTMRVNLSDTQLLSLFVRAKEDGKLNDLLGGKSEESPAAAGDGEGEGEGSSSVNDLITSLNMSKMDIHRVGTDNVYTLTMRATLSITNLLSKALEGENSILKTLTDAIPNSLSFGITVYIHTDADGNVTYVGADEAGQHQTSFLLNAFDETYTLRVIQTISTLLRCLGAGEGLKTDEIITKVDDAFQSIFDKIHDYLYCHVALQEGRLILPSLYEVVQGFSHKKIDASETLTEADLLTTAEIKDVLQNMYHSTYAPASYEGTPGDAMLADLQSKYYLSTSWTAADLFGEGANIGDKINADSINFRDPVDEGGDPIIKEGNVVHGLYRDDRSLDNLRVNIAGEALADLLTQSGKLDNLVGEGESGMIKSLSVVNCTYTVDEQTLYANFHFRAKLTEEVAAAGDESESAGFSLDTVLPDQVYLTARILLHRNDGDYSATARYHTEVIVNNNTPTTDNLFKLVKVFSGEEFNRDKVTDQVSTSVEDAFAKIEESVNFVYGNTAETALQLDNVFNTINKLSNKPTEEQLADPGYVPYVSSTADDQSLCDVLREFGRDPASTTQQVDLTHYAEQQTVVATVDVSAYRSVFGIMGANDAPTKDDQAEFFTELNRNYYIADGKELNIEKVNSGDLVVDDGFISLAKLYQDTRDYSALTTRAYDKQIASIIDGMYAAGIVVTSGTDNLGTAKILAVHMDTTNMQAFIEVRVNSAYANAHMLPEVLYMTSYTYLVKPLDEHGDPLTDEHGTEREKYYTTVRINNMTSDETEDLFHRFDKLSTGMNLNFSIKMDDITAPVQTNVSDVFENKLSTLGDVKYQNGNLEIPSLFAYLADGKLVKDGEGHSSYDKTQYMVDIDISGDATYYANHSADTDPNKTRPEVLMYRMRELGKAQYVDGFGDNLYVWSGWDTSDSVYQLVVSNVDRYNDNPFDNSPALTDENAFYDQLQSLYFFNEDNRPSVSWFQDGTGNMFANLSGGDLSTTFNLHGYVNSFTDPTLAEYATKGLYNYQGTQYGARLTDRALASMMNSLPDALSITAANIHSITVTSASLDWDEVHSVLTIRITVEVTTEAAASALPAKFYMTTVTTRDSSDALHPPVYETRMTINRFAMDSSAVAKDGDLHKLLYNLSHVATLNIKDQLDEQTICDNVSDALRKMLDDKLSDYIAAFGDGYIEFNNIYHEIVTHLNVNRALYPNADLDIQNVICKLQNNRKPDNSYKTYASYNTKGVGDTISPDLMHMSVTVTDRALANVLESHLQSNKGAYVSNVDSIIFVGAADNDLFEEWETLMNDAAASAFALGDATAYVLTTVKVNVSATSVSASVSLLPDDLYLSLVVRYDSVNGNSLVTTFINDFTYSETQLAMSFLTDNSNNLDFEDNIMTIVNTNLPAGTLFTRNPDGTFADYVGQGSYAYVP